MSKPQRRSDRSRDVAAALAATAGSAGASWAAYNYLNGQARIARTVIPHRTDNAPNGDGIYQASGVGPIPMRHDQTWDLHLMVFGDSTAAGLGAAHPDGTPGVRLARALADETGKRIRLSTKAIVGATSRSLAGQVDAMFVSGNRPDLAVIVIGANDITARNGITSSSKRLGDAVARLHEAGCKVIVGTCPDLGVVVAIPQPLRSLLRQWGRSLAAAQTAEVRANGGRPVPMADLLSREFLHAPDRMFSADRYHPSEAGYELAAQLLLPELLAAVGEWGPTPLPDPPSVSEVAESNRWVVRGRKALQRRLHDR